MTDEFPKIQRGNGVLNDNLATLGDIMLATKNQISALENSTIKVNEELVKVKEAIRRIDQQNTPREIKSFWLLVTTVVIGVVGVFVSILAFLK